MCMNNKEVEEQHHDKECNTYDPRQHLIKTKEQMLCFHSTENTCGV